MKRSLLSTMRPSVSTLSSESTEKRKIVRHLSVCCEKTNMNRKASWVYDHMPTALYVQSDTYSPDSEETKQDVQPIWNRVPARTAETTQQQTQVLQTKYKWCKSYEGYVKGKLLKCVLWFCLRCWSALYAFDLVSQNTKKQQKTEYQKKKKKNRTQKK